MDKFVGEMPKKFLWYNKIYFLPMFILLPIVTKAVKQSRVEIFAYLLD